MGREVPPHSDDEPTRGNGRSVVGERWKMALWLCTVDVKDLYLPNNRMRNVLHRVTNSLTTSICG